jgi:hypothetical protein
MRPLFGVIPGCSLSSETGKSAEMNTDSRGENRVHARVAPDYFGATASDVALPTPLATDWEFREYPLVKGFAVATPALQNVMRRSGVESRTSPRAKAIGLPRVGGLHHRYAWREAS